MEAAEERARLEAAIEAIEAQRSLLGDAATDAALAPLRERLEALQEVPRPEWKGERRFVVVLFADLAGFTAMAETMDPERVHTLLNTCFDRLVPIVYRYGGTVDKFLGDAIMALFGAPVAHEDDPDRALYAALEMMAEITALDAEQGSRLGLHIGVDAGTVVAGHVGTSTRQEYSVIGDAVNMARRLVEAAERDEILVGETLHRLTSARFEFDPPELLWVKGKRAALSVYRLVHPQAAVGRRRHLAGLYSPLVGRQAELRALQEAVERLCSGQGGIVMLVGEAGLGKSRLVAELRHRSGAPPLRWVEGRCLAYGRPLAYHFWREALRDLLNLTPQDGPAATRRALQEQVRALGLDDGPVRPLLAQLLALPPSQEEVVVGTFEEHPVALRHALEAFWAAIAQEHPLVLVGEDLHWADGASLDLLEPLLALSERAPILFLCTFRPDPENAGPRLARTAAERHPHRYTAIHLLSLSSQESSALLHNLLRDPPPELAEEILGRAAGNPLYIEEIVRSLLDRQAIRQDPTDGRWRPAGDLSTIAIPDSLQGVLMERIDSLPTGTRRLLHLAAVIGRTFSHRLLAAVADDLLDAGWEEHLRTLERETMLLRLPRPGEPVYSFKHPLIRQTAYDSLLQRDRRLLHRRVAEAVEQRFPDRIEEQLGLLAHHWEEAGVPERALPYLLRAGDQIRLAYAHQEALEYYRRALTLLQEQHDDEQAARTWMRIALAYQGAFQFEQAQRAYARSFSLWQKANAAAQERTLHRPIAPHPLRMAQLGPTTLDPTMAEDEYSVSLIEQLFVGLVELGPDMSILPAIADSWEILHDGRTYLFHLRHGACWSDGRPVTADDFACAWRRVLDPARNSPVAHLLYDIQGARSFHQGEADDLGVVPLDATTLAVELADPCSYFLYLLACSPACPVPTHVVSRYGEAWASPEHIVTNGPFLLERWEPGRRILLSRNPTACGHFSGNLERVEVALIPEWSDSLERYAADELDLLNLWMLPLVEIVRARSRFAGEYLMAPAQVTTFVGFNTGRPPFDDERVRRAFALATDREHLANVVMQGLNPPARGGLVPPGMPAHSPDIGLPFDPAAARSLPRPAEVTLSLYHGAEQVGAFLQKQWQENLGLRVHCEPLEWGEFLDRLDRGETQVFLNAWFADYPDPDNFLRVCSARHWARWDDPDYTALVERARRIADPQERLHLYRQADRLLVGQVVLLPLSYGRQHLLLKPWVKRFPISVTRTWFWKDVLLEPHR